MASKIEIINMSLTRLGEQPINALDEGSEPANIVSRVYDIALKSELTRWPWTFATTTAELAEVSEDPPDFSNVFQLPADFVKIVSIINPGTGYIYWRWYPYNLNYERLQHSWKFRGDKLYINSSEATIEYVKLEEDPTQWTDEFTNMFAWRLAAEIARPLTGRVEDVQNALTQHAVASSIARGNDGANTRLPTDISRDYMKARRW